MAPTAPPYTSTSVPQAIQLPLQLIRHFNTCTTDIYLQNECAHVGLSSTSVPQAIQLPLPRQRPLSPGGLLERQGAQTLAARLAIRRPVLLRLRLRRPGKRHPHPQLRATSGLQV